MPDLNHIFDQVAPWLAAGAVIYVIFGFIVFGLVISVFVFVFKQMRKMSKEFDDMERDMFPKMR